MKIGQPTDISMGNILTKNFVLFEGLARKSRPFFVYQLTAINNEPIMTSL